MSVLLETSVCLSMIPETDLKQAGCLQPVTSRMSAPGLTSEAQLRYLLQWFGEFSELQREDFLPILVAAHGKNADQLATTMAALSCQDKPVSLFQCRIKLFNEWFPSWTEELQDRLVKGVSEMDTEYGTKLQKYLTDDPPMNGDCNGITEENNVVVEAKPLDEWEII